MMKDKVIVLAGFFVCVLLLSNVCFVETVKADFAIAGLLSEIENFEGMEIGTDVYDGSWLDFNFSDSYDPDYNCYVRYDNVTGIDKVLRMNAVGNAAANFNLTFNYDYLISSMFDFRVKGWQANHALDMYYYNGADKLVMITSIHFNATRLQFEVYNYSGVSIYSYNDTTYSTSNLPTYEHLMMGFKVKNDLEIQYYFVFGDVYHYVVDDNYWDSGNGSYYNISQIRFMMESGYDVDLFSIECIFADDWYDEIYFDENGIIKQLGTEYHSLMNNYPNENFDGREKILDVSLPDNIQGLNFNYLLSGSQTFVGMVTNLHILVTSQSATGSEWSDLLNFVRLGIGSASTGRQLVGFVDAWSWTGLNYNGDRVYELVWHNINYYIDNEPGPMFFIEPSFAPTNGDMRVLRMDHGVDYNGDGTATMSNGYFDAGSFPNGWNVNVGIGADPVHYFGWEYDDESYNTYDVHYQSEPYYIGSSHRWLLEITDGPYDGYYEIRDVNSYLIKAGQIQKDIGFVEVWDMLDSGVTAGNGYIRIRDGINTSWTGSYFNETFLIQNLPAWQNFSINVHPSAVEIGSYVSVTVNMPSGYTGVIKVKYLEVPGDWFTLMNVSGPLDNETFDNVFAPGYIGGYQMMLDASGSYTRYDDFLCIPLDGILITEPSPGQWVEVDVPFNLKGFNGFISEVTVRIVFVSHNSDNEYMFVVNTQDFDKLISIPTVGMYDVFYEVNAIRGPKLFSIVVGDEGEMTQESINFLIGMMLCLGFGALALWLMDSAYAGAGMMFGMMVFLSVPNQLYTMFPPQVLFMAAFAMVLMFMALLRSN